jgi:hypothetical protein
MNPETFVLCFKIAGTIWFIVFFVLLFYGARLKRKGEW